MGPPRRNYDDTDHLLGDLYLLNLIEDDPELSRFYRKCVRDSWEVHRTDKMAWFNFVYRAVLGKRHADSRGSFWNLQTFPTCRIFQPQMNSIRKDLEFYRDGGVRESLYPLPVYKRPFDNEYTWKQSPYKLDGWLSRIVSVVEVSPHDRHVQLAAETTGYAYWSSTNGEIWHRRSGLRDVHDLLYSTSYPWMVFAATQSGVYRSLDGGEYWEQVLGHPAYRLYSAPNNDHVLYAVVQGAIYRSIDMGERAVGAQWRSIGGPETAGAGRLLDVDPSGPNAMLYMLTSEGLYHKAENDRDWHPPRRPVRTSGFGTAHPIAGRPRWLKATPGPKKRLFRSVIVSRRGRSIPLVSFSEDRGQTWTPLVCQRDQKLVIQDLWVDRDVSDTWYGLLETGIAVTRDGGKNWIVSTEGLDIPRAYSMWIPRNSSDIYVGTPAGLYVSRNKGASWQNTSLILESDWAESQGLRAQGAMRAEIGGIGYLVAYWMGRYHGFITEEKAHERWWE